MSYCDKTRSLDKDHVDRIHHDTVHGFAVNDDEALFERLVLEINQAGLSWTLILRKQENFRRAFDGFDIKKVACYGPDDRSRLLNDPGIVRNRQKVDAAIYNAHVILGLQMQMGSFKAWLDHHHPKALREWTMLFKSTFRFMGPEIVNEFLMGTGYLPGAHSEDCPVYNDVIRSGAPFFKTKTR
ncbi:MAG: DNA-3-methyladenine glycosylase I [Bacteroidia bacterium]|nr:MAG: DNA-3-methyladenine glycosylase I [Bacteroidia bacterium]